MDQTFGTTTRKRKFLNFATKFNRLNRQKLALLPKRKLLIGLGAIVLAVLIGVAAKALISGSNNSVLGVGDQRPEVPGAKKNVAVNKEFSFPLKDDKGKEVAKIKYTIESAELRDQIVVKGQKASSVAGRTFLIFNLKLVNEFTKSVDIKTGDYVRLSVNGNDSEWLAPDVNNDPVSLQAISTKYTRIGFPINDSDHNLRIRIGEIEGEKQVVDVNFK